MFVESSGSKTQVCRGANAIQAFASPLQGPFQHLLLVLHGNFISSSERGSPHIRGASGPANPGHPLREAPICQVLKAERQVPCR